MARAGARTAASRQDSCHAAPRLEHDLVGRVVLAQVHAHALGARGRQVLADDVGADRQLAVPAVAQHGEPDARRAPVVEHRLDRGAHGAPGVEHVVDDHDRRAVEREVERRGLDDRLRMRARLAAAQAHVVAVEGDVERADRHLDAADLGEQRREPACQRDAARVDADEREAIEDSPSRSTISCAMRRSVRPICSASSSTVGAAEAGVLTRSAPSRALWPRL